MQDPECFREHHKQISGTQQNRKTPFNHCLFFIIFHRQRQIQHANTDDMRHRSETMDPRFSSKIKRKPEEVLLPTTDYTAMISELQKETWVHTVESKSLLPSQECLILREKNLSFQLQIWGQATKPQMIIPKPEDYGWEKIDNEFELQADSESNIKKQKTNYDIIMMRCACKSSQCRTRACKCKKAGNHCTALCDCINCENGDIPEAQNPENTIPDITDIMEEDEDSASESETEIGEFEVPDEDDADVDY